MGLTPGRLSDRPKQVPESTVYTVLSNRRRRNALETLRHWGESITVRDLSERIATMESGEDPAPRNLRESVYVSLHQTHLPTLDEHGLIDYDRGRKIVYSTRRARAVRPYLDVRTGLGVTWAAVYQWLGILGLFAMIASLGGVPGLASVPPLLVGSGFLCTFALAGVYRLWRARRRALRQSGRPDP